MSFSSPKRGATVSFHNINYSVKMKSGFICKRKITQKNILIELKQWKSVSSPASSSDTKNMTGIERQDCSTGEDFLSEQGIDYSTWGLWQNHLALGIMTLLFIAYVKLHFIKKFT